VTKAGAPITSLKLGPSVTRINGLAVSKTAKHPHAAMLFQEFTLTDARRILAERGFTPTNIKISPLPKELDIKVVDGAAMLDKLAQWRQAFDTAVK